MIGNKRCRGLWADSHSRHGGAEQTACDAEVTAIEAVVRWMVQQPEASDFRHMWYTLNPPAPSPERGTLELAQANGWQFASLTCFRSCAWIADQ